MIRAGFLGPRGTFSEEALLASADGAVEPVALPTIHATVMAVQDGLVDRAIVPIENALEGPVNPTLDALAIDAPGVEIVGEAVLTVRYCLIARAPVALEDIAVVVSHPQGIAQCARYVRERLPAAQVLPATSTADAVRTVAEGDEPGWAALGTRLAAELYGAHVVAEDVEDVSGNATRFVWLAPRAGDRPRPAGPAKTSVVFWGGGDATPGWLVRCLSEFASRSVNLSKIESRPMRIGLGHYMFFIDCDGHTADAPVADALAGLRGHCEDVRLLGSYPSAS